MKAKCEKLVDAYLKWLKNRISVADVDGICEITTPFLDRYNDRLQIYVESVGNGFRLTDDGYIFSNLESSGLVIQTPKRLEMLRVVLNGFGVHENDGELFVNCSTSEFPQKKHSLVQAMLAVDDMFMTAQPHVVQLFLQDVEDYLEENEVRFSPNVGFSGKSGFVHKFDFVIPSSKRAPERLIRAINRPGRDTATSLLFSWTDTKDQRRRDSRFYVVLNDTEREVSSDLIDAFKHYDVEPIPWSSRAAFTSLLAA